MQNQNQKKLIPLKLTLLLTMLSAMSIVFGKLLAINLGEVLRLSFENLPILFAGIAFGPIAGAAVGLIADIVGCLIVGYAINPLVTLGAVIIGGVAGFLHKLLLKTGIPSQARIALSVAAAHLCGSVIIKTVGLSVFYSMPFGVLMLWRALNYLIVGAAEAIILYFLMKNRGVARAISSMKPSTEEKAPEPEKEINDGL